MTIDAVKSEIQWQAYECEQWRQAVMFRGLQVDSLDLDLRIAISGSFHEVVPTYNQVGLDYAA